MGYKPIKGEEHSAQLSSRHATIASKSAIFLGFDMVVNSRRNTSIATAEDKDQESNEMPLGLSIISLKQVVTIDLAPTVTVHLHTHHGSYHTQVLPDSGADISAAGEHVLPPLNEYRDNLLPSEFTPRAANG